jgi:hypothetical protein
LLGNERSTEQREVIKQKNYRKETVIARAFCEGGDEAEREPERHRHEIQRALLAKMGHSFEQSIDEVDRKNKREEEKNFAMMGVKVNPPIHDRLVIVRIREE